MTPNSILRTPSSPPLIFGSSSSTPVDVNNVAYFDTDTHFITKSIREVH